MKCVSARVTALLCLVSLPGAGQAPTPSSLPATTTGPAESGSQIAPNELKADVEDMARGVDTVLEYTLNLIKDKQRPPGTQMAPRNLQEQ